MAQTVSADVNVVDHGAISGGVNHDVYFNDAIEEASLKGESVYIPAGWWVLTKSTAEASWVIDNGANFLYPTNHTTGNDNLEYLTGTVTMTDWNTHSGFIAGATNWNWITDIRHSAIPHAAINGISAYGTGGISAYTRTSDKVGASEGTIGVTSYVVNDNEDDIGVAYGSYIEVIKTPLAGAVFGEESNISAYGGLERILPSGLYGNTSNIASNYWIGGPVGSGPFNHLYEKVPTSAGITFAGGSAKDANGFNLGFDAGIVFTREAFLNSTDFEIIRTFTNSNITWHGSGYNPAGALTSIVEDENGLVVLRTNNKNGIWKEVRITNTSVVTPTGVSTVTDASQQLGGRVLNTKEQLLKVEVKSIIRAFQKVGGPTKIHIGIKAQDLMQAFTNVGLDYERYDVIQFSDGLYSIKYEQLMLIMME